MNTEKELEKIRNGQPLTTREQILLVALLSLPAILSQLTTVVMQYADAAMVGRLGAEGTAAIGLVSSTTWLTSGLTTALGIGYSVQIAHLIGAKEDKGARSAMRHGLLASLLWSVVTGCIGMLISPHLPVWFGADPAIHKNASLYYFVYAAFLPMLQLRFTAGGMLQSSGEMKVPGMLNIIACFLNVIFNMLFIFPSGAIVLPGAGLPVPGLGLGVLGAALATGLSETICALSMLSFLLLRAQHLRIQRGERSERGAFKKEFVKAIRIGLPIGIEQGVTGGAQVLSTGIVSPLGTVSIAANSLAVNAESLCYMPGYGIGAAASATVGQSIGARRQDLTKRLAWISMCLGMIMMSLCGALLYVFAPQMFSFLTPVREVQKLGTAVLRIELLAEPLFAASIVGAGIFRGAGRTRGSTAINLLGMWVIRLPMAAFLSRRIGLRGVWIAMCTDLCTRGALFLIRLARSFRAPAGKSST